jgi:CpXC protein
MMKKRSGMRSRPQPHSYAERYLHTCGQCDNRFNVTVWLIVDTAERPDLADQIRNATLHDVSCPSGHQETLDAPLLLFRTHVDDDLRVVFSPVETATEEENLEYAQELIDRAKEAFGQEWREEWAQLIVYIGRDTLPLLVR